MISVQDFARLKLEISGVDLEKEAAKKREHDKEAKHQASCNMVKNWRNTIEARNILCESYIMHLNQQGQRLKRLENLKIKEIKEEVCIIYFNSANFMTDAL